MEVTCRTQFRIQRERKVRFVRCKWMGDSGCLSGVLRPRLFTCSCGSPYRSSITEEHTVNETVAQEHIETQDESGTAGKKQR